MPIELADSLNPIGKEKAQNGDSLKTAELLPPTLLTPPQSNQCQKAQPPDWHV